MKPVIIDLFCGKGGWAHGCLTAGAHVIGFDISNMGGYPGELVLQDVRTLHGSQFRNAAAIVASPPCQRYSYMAMPWSRAKAMAANYRANPELIESESNVLYNACFRIQREASEAAGRHIPLVVENVKGAQPWVGSAKANYGSFYLWGSGVDTVNGRIVVGKDLNIRTPQFGHPTIVVSKSTAGLPGEPDPHDGYKSTAHLTNQSESDGIKQGGEWWHDPGSITRRFSSRSAARKEASARIAMIPFDLAYHIGRTFIS